jgi:hypothetical protein
MQKHLLILIFIILCIFSLLSNVVIIAILTGGSTNANTYADLGSGAWVAEAHTNVEPITTYNIPHTEGNRSASGIPDLDNCYLPASIFRGYVRWDANDGYFNLQSTPYLSFDIWVDHSMQIDVGVLDTTNGSNNPASTLIADTYHNGQTNTPPYVYAYGTGKVTSPDGAWIVMTGSNDGSIQHYIIDLRTLNVPITHLQQIVIDMTCAHQFDMNWKILNVVLSSKGV